MSYWGTSMADAVKPLGPRGRNVYRVVRFLIHVVATLLGRVTVEGAEHIPQDRPFVLAPVHRSNVDFALAALVTRRRMRYMAKDSLWKSRPLGWFVSLLGAFPVARGTADREAMQTCIDVLTAGEPLVMFPEGTRRSGPVIEELFDGSCYVAARCGVPVVPVGIGGSEAMMPKGAKMLHRSPLRIVVGAPIESPAPTEGGRVSRKSVKAMTETLHVELQRLFDQSEGRPTT